MKRFSVYVVAALISIGSTYGTYKYLERAKPYSVADTYNYGNEFDQENIRLAALSSEGYPDFTKAAENTVNAVVHIKSITKIESRQGQGQGQRVPSNPFFEYFFGPGQGGGNYDQQPRIGSGSGVIISTDGYIMTNNHVIDKATELEVTLNDNSKHIAKVIGADPDTDIALIKIDKTDLPYVPFGDSDKLKVGEWVIAVGNPFNLTSTVTKGIVSAKARGNIGQGGSGSSIQSFIQTDAAINPGNSGGALVNTQGQLVGINTAIYSQTGNFAGYGFAVPISIAGKVAADIKEHGAVQRAMLGVSIMDVNVAKEVDEEKTKNIKLNEGVYIGGFAEHSPAKQAGVEEGDIIVAINEVKTPSSSILQEQISRFRPGDKIKVDLLRGDNKKSFDIILKNSDGNTSIVKKEDALAIIGVAFKEVSSETKKALGISHGVEVGEIDKSGKFYREGITKGSIILDIDRIPVSSIKEAESLIIKAGNSKDKVLFLKLITSTGESKFQIVKLAD